VLPQMVNLNFDRLLCTLRNGGHQHAQNVVRGEQSPLLHAVVYARWQDEHSYFCLSMPPGRLSGLWTGVANIG